jgi:hypothetical protein
MYEVARPLPVVQGSGVCHSLYIVCFSGVDGLPVRKSAADCSDPVLDPPIDVQPEKPTKAMTNKRMVREIVSGLLAFIESCRLECSVKLVDVDRFCNRAEGLTVFGRMGR